MTDNNSRAPIVAELGRPETPQETAARTALNSRNHRSRQTVNNLVYSLLATLAIVAVIILMVPRSTPLSETNVDFAAIAATGQGSEPDPLAVPKLSKAWTSNSAALRTADGNGVDSWYVGLITPSRQYIGFTQGFSANDTWLSQLLEDTTGTGAVTIDGVTWTVYDNRNSAADVGNVEYALTAASGASTYVLLGTAKPSEFDTVAQSLAAQIKANHQKGSQ
ncbi:DUF4245 domain-containing protein [Rathayibacter soli]|uniref:DUF4245 domain-containing protein n=1 Tax=Rathayibacter soli TaxID=3144168 RepID=UPI0027E44FE5|nr:DUF4245 domain-containing protein [Glaciibacter superstes]